jgi:hypothetical protein
MADGVFTILSTRKTFSRRRVLAHGDISLFCVFYLFSRLSISLLL